MSRHSEAATRNNRVIKPKAHPGDTTDKAFRLWREGERKGDRGKKLAAHRMWRRLAMTWASRRNSAERYGVERGWIKVDPFARVVRD